MGTFTIVDIVILIVLAIFGIIGLCKGFIKQIGKLIALVLAVAAAVFLFKGVAEFIYKLGFIANMESKLVAKFEAIELFKVSAIEGQTAMEAALNAIKIPGFVQNLLFKLIDFETLPDQPLSIFLSDIIIKYACFAVSFLLIFIVARIIVGIIVKAISKAIDVVPGAGLFNRLLGMAFSVGKILLVIWVLLYGLTFLSFIPKLYDTLNNFITTYTADSVVAKFIVEHNGVSWIIGKFLTK